MELSYCTKTHFQSLIWIDAVHLSFFRHKVRIGNLNNLHDPSLLSVSLDILTFSHAVIGPNPHPDKLSMRLW